jgi:hypothetical protein
MEDTKKEFYKRFEDLATFDSGPSQDYIDNLWGWIEQKLEKEYRRGFENGAKMDKEDLKNMIKDIAKAAYKNPAKAWQKEVGGEYNICHVNPNCIDATRCNPHGETGPVTYHI